MSVTYVEPFTLAAWLRGPERSEVLVLDVRDDDFEDGGHIKGALNAPSGTLADDQSLDYLMDSKLAGAKRVVVHCMFSQVRGPRTALRLAGRFAARGLPQPALMVLRGGFGEFGRIYGADADLVEKS